MSKSFYVYVHRKLTDNQPFYVGKGTGSRAYKKHGRNEYWQRVVNKHGYFVEIVFDNLSEDEAFRCEIDTILEFQYFGYDLCNLTKGGEGVSGRKLSSAEKSRLSQGMKGRKRSVESIEKTRLATLGRKRTPEQNAKNSKAQVGNKNKEDKNHYVFYSESDIYVGTRRNFEKYAGLTNYSSNQLFGTSNRKRQKRKSVNGWSVLTFTQFVLFNFLI